MTSQLNLTALGALALEIHGQPALVGRRKPLTLLAYLVRREGVRMRRAELAALFWPSADEPRARQSLRQTLTELRDVLGATLSVTDELVWLVPGALGLDANAFQAAIKEGNHAEALRLWGGDFLADAEATAGEELRSWLEAEREELRRALAAASDAEVQRLMAQGAWDQAAIAAKLWTGRAPYDERAARRLVEVLMMAGRRADAAAEYQSGRLRLQTIGLAPSPEFATLGATAERPAADSKLGVFALMSPDLVSRADAIAVLQSSWHRVLRGESGAIVVTGDPGNGKSRLQEEFVRNVRRDTPRAIVLHTRAFEVESEAPCALVRHLFAGLARAPGLASSPAAVLNSLAKWIPEIAEAFPQISADHVVPVPEAVTRAVTDVGAETPILIAVDDAHLADAESHKVLEALCRRPPANVLIVLCAPAERAGEFAGTRLLLSNLDLAGVEQLLASMAEFRPGDRRLLGRRLFEETKGNPLAVVEIVRALAEQGAIGPGPDGGWTARSLGADTPLPVPVTLREAALARIEGLNPDALAVLEASVVVGRELDPEMLLELTGFESERLERALEDLIGRRLLRASMDGSSRLEFAHEHLRRGVYESLPPLRRAQWHQRSYRVLKRRTSRDSTRAAVLAHHRDRAAARPRKWSRSPAVWAALAVLAVILVAALWYRSRPVRSGIGTVVRVAAFQVDGDTAFRFLGRAVADLVARGLNGSAGLRSVDSGPADLVVTGRVVATAGRVSIQASLSEAGSPDRPLAQASAEGEGHEAVTISREVARQLLQSRAGTAVSAAGVLAWVNTHSIDALREYLEGERLFLSLDVPEAIQAYRRATRLDTTFAVAWYRIGESGLWLLRSDVARVGADSALHYVTGVDPNEVIHYRAFRDFANGRIRDAEAKLRGEIAVFPHRTESRYLLADLLYHFYWLKGVSNRESRLLFEGLRRDQPGDWRPLFHLWDIAVADGRLAEAAALRDTVQALAPAADLFTGFDAITRFSAADSAGRVIILDSLSGQDQWTLANVVRRYANLSGDPDGTFELAGLLTLPGRPPEVRATGHVFRSVAALSQGRFAEAKEEARLAETLSPITGFQWAALLLGPGLSGGAELERERTRLRGTLAGSGGIALVPLAAPYYPWTDFDRRDAEDIFPYLRGRLALNAGDTVEAGEWLERLSRPSDAPGELRAWLAVSLRGALAAQRGDRSSAIATLDSAFAQRPVDHSIMSIFAAQPEERYAEALWLAAEGRRDEAVAWLSGIGQGSIFDLALLAPASFRLGELLEAQGNRDRARTAYQRVVALYRNADPEFKPLADTAAERLTILQNGNRK